MGLMDKIEAAQLRSDRPDVAPGDTVEVSVRVVEGDKERQQKFRGEVINVRGSGVRKSFTVRKTSEGIGVERTFPLHGPSLGEITILKRAKVRRAKLFYLRRRSGKAARLKEKAVTPAVAKAAAAKASAAKAAAKADAAKAAAKKAEAKTSGPKQAKAAVTEESAAT